jgi:hypothetical protein
MSRMAMDCGLPAQQRRPSAVERTLRLLDLHLVIPCSGSRSISLLIANILLAVAGVLVLASPAWAALSKVPDDTVDANGRVSAIVRVGDRIYLGGSFTALKTKDGQSVPRNYLAAVDANTGEIVSEWNPNANGSVRTIVLSPDENRLYVGGTFTSVGGLTRNRLAAIDLATGAVDKQWSAGANSTVWTLAVSDAGV